MSLQKELTALDNLVIEGEFLKAVDKFFADEVVSHYGSEDVVNGKQNKKEGLEYFFNTIASTDEITLHEAVANGKETYSLFTFDFTQKWGNKVTWHEVVRRVWNDGKVVEEEYILAGSPDEAKQIFTERAPKRKIVRRVVSVSSKPSTTKVAAPKAKAETKTAAPKAKAATKKTASKTTSKKSKSTGADDLKKIEGIGPKIAGLLNDNGIMTFDDLAKSKNKAIKAILLSAGKRYQMHDPKTWSKQAKMAAAGKWEALKKWQDELKGGK